MQLCHFEEVRKARIFTISLLFPNLFNDSFSTANSISSLHSENYSYYWSEKKKYIVSLVFFFFPVIFWVSLSFFSNFLF